jgi:hypothetical protein
LVAGAKGKSRFDMRALAQPLSMLVLFGLTALLAVAAYRYIFSTFDTPDDEGYLIVTLRSFADGNALYDEVFSQYGPGFYTLVAGAMKILGVAFTSDGARWVNLAFWLSSTLLIGVILQRLTRNLGIAAAGLGLGFLVLISDAAEPLHPGAAIGFMLLALVAALVFGFERRPGLALGFVGALAVALAATKVNIGALAIVSLLFACAACCTPLARRRGVVAIAALLFVGVPFVLMGSKLGTADTLRLALTASGGALAVVLACLYRGSDERPTLADLRWLGLGAVAMLALVCVVPVILGTSPGGLIHGWLLNPLGYSDTTYNVVVLGNPGLIWTLLGLLGASALAFAGADQRWQRPGAVAALGVLRLAIGAGMWITLSGAVLGSPADLPRTIAFATPFAWVITIPPVRRSGAEPSRAAVEAPSLGAVGGRGFVRVAIAALAVLQTLHAYPVPGAQLAWSTILFVIVGGICIADAATSLRTALDLPAAGVAIGAAAIALGFGVWLAADRIDPFRDLADANYDASVPLDLPGAERQRVDLPRAENLRALTAGIEDNCDSFVTLPGLSSLYLYTGQEPPEEVSSSWMLILDDADQQAIVDRVEDSPRLCAVIKPDLLDFWRVYAPHAQIPERPLVRFIEDDFRPIHDYSGYILAVHRGQG